MWTQHFIKNELEHDTSSKNKLEHSTSSVHQTMDLNTVSVHLNLDMAVLQKGMYPKCKHHKGQMKLTRAC